MQNRNLGELNFLYAGVFVFLASILVYAESSEVRPFQQMMENNLDISTRESTVEINGAKYRKIEIENETYYFEFKGLENEIPVLLCKKPTGFETEHLVEATIKVNRRKAVFVRALKVSCEEKHGLVQQNVQLDPKIGVYFSDSPKDKLKKKSVGVNPLNPSKLNFGAEF